MRSSVSMSSLQLTLENKELGEVKRQYLDQLDPSLNGKTDVVGFLFATHGQINSTEVYNNKNLFRTLWPKLLDAAITEEITEYNPGGHSEGVPAGAL